MRILLKNFHIVDSRLDTQGSIIIEDGKIHSVIQDASKRVKRNLGQSSAEPAVVIDGKEIKTSGGKLPLLMPAFVDLHAHFRDPCISGVAVPVSETLESASLAAAAGGFATVICMANTKPAIDTIERAAAVKDRADTLGLIDLYPVISLSKNLEGKELSEINKLPGRAAYIPLMLSDDGKDIADDALFLSAMKEAKRIGIPVSCHCDLDGESNAIRRAIELGKKTGCHIHIAHVSEKTAINIIRCAKAELPGDKSKGFKLTCEVMPHNLSLTNDDAIKLGIDSFGRVNPPLRTEEDRKALIDGLLDGTIDAIATDHAPHSTVDKENGAPGFSGLETAFSVCYTTLIRDGQIDLSLLSRLMSENPASIFGLGGSKGRGRIASGMRADLVIIDPDEQWVVDPAFLMTRGKNSPFTGKELYGKILMTFSKGQIIKG